MLPALTKTLMTNRPEREEEVLIRGDKEAWFRMWHSILEKKTFYLYLVNWWAVRELMSNKS